MSENLIKRLREEAKHYRMFLFDGAANLMQEAADALESSPAPVQVPDVSEVLAVLDDICRLDPTASTLAVAQYGAGHLAQRIRHKLAVSAPVQVPEGWKLVPEIVRELIMEVRRHGSLRLASLAIRADSALAAAPAAPSVDAEKVMALDDEQHRAVKEAADLLEAIADYERKNGTVSHLVDANEVAEVAEIVSEWAMSAAARRSGPVLRALLTPAIANQEAQDGR